MRTSPACASSRLRGLALASVFSTGLKTGLSTLLKGALCVGMILGSVCLTACAQNAEPGAEGQDGHDHVDPESGEIGERTGGWRLASEASPYLRQHADNTVDWYAWGPEAFERAVAENNPIFLSIGYSACHWCHVMEHESFEDEATGAYLRKHFISIKVDREQRPDVDSRYMTAVQQMTGSGGWPLTAFLTPEGAPFYGGTYFPSKPMRQMPTFLDVLEWVNSIWTDDQQNVRELAQKNHRGLQRDIFPQPKEWDARGLLTDASAAMIDGLDPIYGGMRSTRPQRFPPSMLLRFLFRQQLRGGELNLSRAYLTLDMMASGGMRDHVGGGFHRYSVDPQWKVPHFEKMLYDNGVLAATYAEAYALSGREFYGDVARDTLQWLMRDMRSPEGLYYSARDADSLPFGQDGQALPGVHPEEGDVYTWTLPELKAALGDTDGLLFAKVFDIRKSDRGNFERGRSIPMPLKALDKLAQAPGDALPQGAAFLTWVRSAYDRLLVVRDRRPQAFRDEKSLSAWNGLALTGFAVSARLLDEDTLRAESDSLARALRDTLLREDEAGELWVDHQWFEGQASGDGVLTDYAYCARGFLDAYHASGNTDWLVVSYRLAQRMLDLFEDEHQGGLFETLGNDPLLPGRTRELTDGARASGHSVALHHLLRMAPLDDSGRFAAAVERAINSVGPLAGRSPQSFTSALTAVDAWLGPLTEVVVHVANDSTAGAALQQTARHSFLPAELFVPDAHRASEALLADVLDEEPLLLAGRRAESGEAKAWVCKSGVCLLPVSSAEELEQQLLSVSRR